MHILFINNSNIDVFIVRNWLLWLWRLATSKSANGLADQEPRGELMLQLKPSCSEVNLSFFSANWMRPIHVMEDNLLYSKPTSLNVPLNPKHPHRSNQNVWPNIGRWGPRKSIHTMKHHRDVLPSSLAWVWQVPGPLWLVTGDINSLPLGSSQQCT